jgi:pimeloyl-ACP methyl ester carboxylesterase
VSRVADLGWRATGRVVSVPPAVDLPAGSLLDLPNGERTFVVDTGPPQHDEPGRPVLVLLHALACTGLLTWYPTIAALRSHYRIVTFDQRWHGQGPRPEQFSLEDCADDVVAVCDALGIDEALLVGYSMGSMIAQLTWRRSPQRVAGVVLGASTTRFSPPGREPFALRAVSSRLSLAAQRRQSAIPDEEIADAVAAAAAIDPSDHNRWALAQLRTTTKAGIAGAAAVISTFDSSAWIHRMDVPAAVVITTADRVIRPERQRWLAKQIPTATQYEVAAGHAAVVMRADRFIPAVRAACASVSARIAAQR